MRPIRTSRTRRAVSATALALTLALATAACGDDEDSSDSSDTGARVSTTEHDDTDVAFASDMLRHHAQALAMVDLTQGRTLDPEVRQLADAIEAAQAPDIETFTGWLTDWDEKVPTTRSGGSMREGMRGEGMRGEGMRGEGMRGEGMRGEDMRGEDMRGEGMMTDTDMPGLMTGTEMTALAQAPDAEFQDMWLQMMIEHHAGAVGMAEVETEHGQYEPAVDLAADIAASQTTEIQAMEDLLAS